MGTQQEKIMGSEGGFYGFDYGRWNFLNILVLAIKKVVRYYGLP